MKLTLKYQDGNPDRAYPSFVPAPATLSPSHSDTILDIDESELSWFYIAPGTEGTESCRRLMALARNLMGPNAWAVLQGNDLQCQELCRELGLRIVESYVNEAPGPFGVSVHLVRTTQQDAVL